MQMLPKIVDNLVLLKKGIFMKLPSGEPVLVTCPIQFITADNARHAELASSRGARSNYPCRKCDWLVKTATTVGGGSDYECDKRSEAIIRSLHEKHARSGNPKGLLDDDDVCYKVVGGQALLRLKSFDTMLDCPIESLHSIMLGVAKKLTKEQSLAQHLTPAQKELLQSFLFNYNSKGFKRKLRSFLRLVGSFLERDFKILVQQLPIALNQLFAQRKIVPDTALLKLMKCFDTFGELSSLEYISKIKQDQSHYVQLLRAT